MPSKAYIDRIESITPEGIFLHLSIIGPKSVKIEQIESKNPKQGLGTKAMQQLVDLADQMGIKLLLEVQMDDDDNDDDSEIEQNNDKNISPYKLIDWYERFGFEQYDASFYGIIMVRKPKSASGLQEQVRKPFKMTLPPDMVKLAQIIHGAGHELYVVGGAVRDALLGKKPKDYDVATDATPEKILQILSQHPEYKTLEIGKSFGIINVITPEGNEYEVATFREDIGKGRRPDAVAFTTIENDVKRRDLTINALFYDIAKGEVVDFVGGLEDIKKGVVRAVGNPSERFDEDRLRILRVIRFAARMGAGMDEGTENAILQDNSLAGVSAERIRDEFLKSIQSAKSVKALHAFYDTFDLWPQVFPGLKINSWYHETKNVPVQLALLLRDNDPQVLAKKLNNLKYSVNEIRQVTFLIMLQELQPETAYQLKKLFVTTGLSEADLEEFATMAGKPDMKLLKAFNKYQPSVKGQELMDLGFKGRELGQELQRRETENFRNLL